ncbi:MAG: hypothetical protein IPO27_13140 [Bacteroidetes bacterium]|nr:hypothetical protein [Bacteroidota bacterium]
MKHLIGIAFLVVLMQVCAAQEKKEKTKSPWKDKISVGGNLGLQFGNPTLIDVSPTLGYRVNEKFMPGIGATYIYNSWRDFDGNRSQISVYGGRLFARYMVISNLFLHGEYEVLNFPLYADNTSRQWVPALLVGGGYSQQIGNRSSVNVMILWNVLQDGTRPSLYNNPIIRVGFNL